MKTETTTDRTRVVFDSGGGITLQLPGFAHFYSGNPQQAAEDFRAYSLTHSTAGWDGHEPESEELNPTPEEIRNGGYRVMELSDVIMAVHGEDEAGRSQYWGRAQLDFVNALRDMEGLSPI